MKLINNRKRILFILAMILIMGSIMTACTGSSKLPEDAVAVVNGSNISIDNFEKTLALQRMSYEAEYGEELLNQDLGSGMTLLDSIKERILEQLILEELVLQEATKKNIEITDEEIEERYTAYKEFADGNEEFKKFSEENNIDEEYIKEQLKKDLVIHKYRDAFIEEVEISSEDAKKYYDENTEYFTIEEVTAKHILVRVTEEDNKDKAKEKAEEILGKINSPEDFLKEWEAYESQDDSTIIAEDLGSFGRGIMVPEFEEVAFSLNPKEISDVVETSFGYHIILVEDYNKEESKFEDVEIYIVEYLKEEAFQKNLMELMDNAKITKKEEL
ncbi:MAG: hypothetical protein GX214_07465 [Clostridiales bacterium]|nr:hypothetical protein [Clostridiales bacterium]